MENIEEIIKGCKNGKRDAQKALYNFFQRKMYSVCLRYTSNYAEAQDIAQEGFIKVFKYINQFKHSGPIEAWIVRIMINTALEKYKRIPTLYIMDDVVQYECDLNYNDIISNISAKDIIILIQGLSPQYRIVFNLYAIEGYSHAEIGGMLGISENTSRSNLLRAKAILQKKVIKDFSFGKEDKTFNNA